MVHTNLMNRKVTCISVELPQFPDPDTQDTYHYPHPIAHSLRNLPEERLDLGVQGPQKTTKDM